MSPFLKRREPSNVVEGQIKRTERKPKNPSSHKRPPKNTSKPQFVASPTWGSFRDFWTDCEMTITPYLSGFVDIEGGHLGISGFWLEKCFDCMYEASCSTCGREMENYLQIRAGDGDGIYSVFELHFEQNAVGALVILDEGSQFATEAMASIAETTERQQEDPQALVDFYKSFYKYFYKFIGDLDRSLGMYCIGEISAGMNPVFSRGSEPSGILIFGESGEGKDSNQSIVTVDNVLPGNYRTFIFAHRNLQNENILMPRMLLLLEESAAESIGLSKDFADRVNFKDELDRWSNSTVFSRIGEPLASYAISANINWGDLRVAKAIVEEDLEMAMTMKMESLSWILLLQMHASSNESQKYLEESLSELGLSSETIHQARGQFNRRII